MAHPRASAYATATRRPDARIAFLVALLLAWGVGAVTLAPPATAATVTAGDVAAYYARNSLVGVDYDLGGREENSFDCSGSVYLAWKHALPGVVGYGSSSSQYRTSGTKIHVGRNTTLKSSALKPGDLMFWSETGKVPDISHVAMYLGNGQILQTAKGKRSWIGSLNFNKGERMAYALRPAGSDSRVSTVKYDAMKAGLADEFAYGDFNGDGREDVLWFTGTLSEDERWVGWQVAYGTSKGFTTFRKAFDSAASRVDQELAVGDFDGDGKDDVLWFTGILADDELQHSGWELAKGTDSGFADFAMVRNTTMTPASKALAYGDFNGDGADDVLWFTGTSRSTSKWRGWQLSAGGPSGFESFVQAGWSSLTPSSHALAFGDFNGDGADDVLWFTGTTDRAKTYRGWQMAYGSAGGFSALTRVRVSPLTPRTTSLAFGDFNGDGADDVLWTTGRRSGTFTGWQLAAGQSAGFSSFARVSMSAVSGFDKPLAFGDFNGDGVDDALWFTGTMNTSRKYYGWQMSRGRETTFRAFDLVKRTSITPYLQ